MRLPGGGPPDDGDDRSKNERDDEEPCQHYATVPKKDDQPLGAPPYAEHNHQGNRSDDDGERALGAHGLVNDLQDKPQFIGV